MRVLLVNDWTANEGGIEVYVTRVSEALRATGWEVRLLTSSVGAAAGGQADYVALGTDNLLAQTFLQIVNPFAMTRLRAALREFRPDVVQVNMFEQYLSPGIFEVLRDVPTVVVVHYYKPVCPTAMKVLPDGSLCEVPAGRICWSGGCVGLARWLRDRPRYALIRSGLARASSVLACSRWMVEQLRLNGIRSEVIPLPVPAPGPSFVRTPAPEPRFVYVGRLDWEKGVDLLLRAFARVVADRPAARLQMVGGGPRQSALQSLATDLGISGAVRFMGRASFEQVEAMLGHAWALVAPSLWPEPLGLTAIEAITRGVPAVASASGGFAETVEEGVSGYLVPNGDEGALVDRLLSVIDAGPRAVPDGVIRELQHRHDGTAHAARLSTVFQEAVERGRDRAG